MSDHFQGIGPLKVMGAILQLGEREKNENEQGCCIAVGLASELSVWTHGFQYRVIAPDLDVKVGACKCVYVHVCIVHTCIPCLSIGSMTPQEQ